MATENDTLIHDLIKEVNINKEALEAFTYAFAQADDTDNKVLHYILLSQQQIMANIENQLFNLFKNNKQEQQQ